MPLLEWSGDLQFGDFPGSHSLVKGGMESVIRALEGGLSRTSILLNTEVTKCTESVHASRNEHAVTLETADGREFKCKFVVITISLGMLKTKARSWIAPPYQMTYATPLPALI